MKAQIQFGVELRRHRTEQKITQEELASRAGMSVPYLRGLESGRYNPTLNVIFDLGKALDVHPADIIQSIPVDAETRDPERKRPGPAEGTPRGKR